MNTTKPRRQRRKPSVGLYDREALDYLLYEQRRRGDRTAGRTLAKLILEHRYLSQTSSPSSPARVRSP